MDNPLEISNQTASLFVLYLILSANFLVPLFPCRAQSFLQGSMLSRHILGYLTMTFFVVLTNQKNPLEISKLFGMSFLLYLWFILTTRMDVYMFLALIILIGGAYILQLYENDLAEKSAENNQAAINKIQLAKKIIAGIALAVTGIGVVLYYGEKRIEYGTKFSHVNFILGSSVCRGKSPDVSYAEILKNLFSGKGT
jgi:hypothetical protein